MLMNTFIPKDLPMTARLFAVSLAMLTLGAPALAIDLPAGASADGVSADINCAALYSNLSRLDPDAGAAWRTRGEAAVNAHVEAHPPVSGREDQYSTMVRDALVARIEALGAPILALNADTSMDRSERMAAMIAEFTAIWSGVRVCDARYSIEPLPSPFNWID